MENWPLKIILKIYYKSEYPSFLNIIQPITVDRKQAIETLGNSNDNSGVYSVLFHNQLPSSIKWIPVTSL